MWFTSPSNHKSLFYTVWRMLRMKIKIPPSVDLCNPTRSYIVSPQTNIIGPVMSVYICNGILLRCLCFWHKAAAHLKLLQQCWHAAAEGRCEGKYRPHKQKRDRYKWWVSQGSCCIRQCSVLSKANYSVSIGFYFIIIAFY